MQQTVYFIDTQNKSLETFTQLIQQEQIQVVLDIRQNICQNSNPILYPDILEKYLFHIQIGFRKLSQELSSNQSEVRKSIRYQEALYYLECGLSFDYKIAILTNDLRIQCKIVKNDLVRRGYKVVEVLDKIPENKPV